jgi:uncharacterized repeat protein (TIGR03803 family)
MAAALQSCSGSPQLAPSGSSSALLQQSKITPLRLERVLYSFKGGNDGANPYGGLLAGTSGVFYGTTSAGGTSGDGTVFELTPSGKVTLYSFKGGNDGATPLSGLVAAGGVLYGTTESGGGASSCSGGCGTVYALTPSGSGSTERVLYAFAGGSDGAYPVGGLLIDKNGALYGTTQAGGGSSSCTQASEAVGCGTVFKLTPSGSSYSESVLYAFQGGNDGSQPESTLIADKSGALYGTTEWGGGTSCSVSGSSGCGAAFKLTPSGSVYTESIIYRFQGGSQDGSNPRSALLAGESGALYGATLSGGAQSAGTVYELTPSGSTYTEDVIHSFSVKNGGDPSDENGLVADSSGNLYGTTTVGGRRACSCGTVFKLTHSAHPRWVEKQIYAFAGSRFHGDGSTPYGSVVIDSTGHLYGMTYAGGASHAGIIFEAMAKAGT